MMAFAACLPVAAVVSAADSQANALPPAPEVISLPETPTLSGNRSAATSNPARVPQPRPTHEGRGGTSPGKLRKPFPIVYSWSKRTLQGGKVKGITVSDKAISTYDPLPEVGRLTGNFKEANLVYRDAAGKETTIYDCIGNDKLHCAALDGRVSPDGKKIAFWVSFAKGIKQKLWTLHGQLPIPTIKGTLRTQIHIHDLTTGNTRAWNSPMRQLDMHPEWISNDKLVFVSNRSRVYPVYLPKKSAPYHWAIQRHTANIDGTNVVNIGPHDDVVLHPYVLSNGNILSANWRVDERLGQDQGNGRVTLQNEWWMTETDQFGAGEVTVFGAHGLSYKATTGKHESLLALHFYGERSNGDLLTANYYRRRHVGGFGQVLVIQRLPHGVEGTGNSLFPAVYPINPYGQEEDNPTHRDSRTGQFYGKANYPVGLPGNQVMLVYGTGYCFELPIKKANDEFLKDGPGCDAGIYMTTKIPSSHPSDFVKIVDDPARHEFSPDIALPYKAIYGKEMPEQQVREVQTDANGAQFCSLEVINVHRAKLHRPKSKKPCTKIGACIQAGYTVEKDLHRFAIYETQVNKVSQRKMQNQKIALPKEGHETKLLGYATPERDGSLAVKVPCETPIKMRGVAQDGTVFIRDQIKHSLRSGEARRCIGCHGGHTENEYHEIGGMDAWNDTIASKKPPQELMPR